MAPEFFTGYGCGVPVGFLTRETAPGQQVRAKEERMRKIWIVVFSLVLAGCSGGVRSSLVEMDMRVASPMLRLNDDVPVVYPYQAAGGGRDPMVNAFGFSWESLESAYGEYRFNP